MNIVKIYFDLNPYDIQAEFKNKKIENNFFDYLKKE